MQTPIPTVTYFSFIYTILTCFSSIETYCYMTCSAKTVVLEYVDIRGEMRGYGLKMR